MKIRNSIFLILAALSISACSTDSKRIDYKVASIRVPSLEVPPDLTNIAPNEQYSIPGADDALVANYSDYSKGTKAESPKDVVVLPAYKNTRIERNDTQRWLAVNDSAENVWPMVKAFWLDIGFQIQVENPEGGVMQTDWQENRGNIPQSGLRTLLSKAFDSLKPAGQRDQYSIRFERSQTGNSTNIFISRQVMIEVKSSGQKESNWALHDVKDPEIENAVMQLLLAKLGGAEKNAPTATSEVSAAASITEPLPVATVELKELAGSKVIQLNEAFDKSWRKVGLALDKARLAVEDKDRTKGQYLLKAATESKGKKDKKSDNYMIFLRENTSGCELSVRNAEGKSDSESMRIIELLFQHIEK